jgi:hypothetical protein
MTTTVTTVTFKRIKEHVLALKEKPDRRGVLVRPAELRPQLQATDADWQFSDAEMITAVRPLANHGYIAVLHSSAGEEVILLAPELLVDLAASIVLQADKHPRELGALSETTLLQGGYPFAELSNLAVAERQVLLDATVGRFLSHNICFRETLGADAFNGNRQCLIWLIMRNQTKRRAASRHLNQKCSKNSNGHAKCWKRSSVGYRCWKSRPPNMAKIVRRTSQPK